MYKYVTTRIILLIVHPLMKANAVEVSDLSPERPFSRQKTLES